MSKARKPKVIAGWVLHGLIGAAMIMAGAFKFSAFASPEMVAEMTKSGLGEEMTLIGVGEVATALLLLFPRTLSLGLLLTSAFWGGAICLLMSKNESYVAQSILLLLTWLGAYLRDPRTFVSFQGPDRTTS